MWCSLRASVLVLTLCVSAVSSTVQAQSQSPSAGKRVALVIGNNTAGAEMMADTAKHLAGQLTTFEFDVVPAYNLNEADLRAQVTAFREKARDAEVAVLYYGGATAIDTTRKVSFITPASWTPGSASLSDTLMLNGLIEEMGRSSKANLVVLDAVMAEIAPEQGRSIGYGLTSLEGRQGNLMLAYSLTRSDALMGQAPALSAALAKQLRPNRINLTKVAALVRRDMVVSTDGLRVPEISGSLPEGSLLDLSRLQGQGTDPIVLFERFIRERDAGNAEVRSAYAQLRRLCPAQAEDAKFDEQIKVALRDPKTSIGNDAGVLFEAGLRTSAGVLPFDKCPFGWFFAPAVPPQADRPPVGKAPKAKSTREQSNRVRAQPTATPSPVAVPRTPVAVHRKQRGPQGVPAAQAAPPSRPPNAGNF